MEYATAQADPRIVRSGGIIGASQLGDIDVESSELERALVAIDQLNDCLNAARDGLNSIALRLGGPVPETASGTTAPQPVYSNGLVGRLREKISIADEIGADLHSLLRRLNRIA